MSASRRLIRALEADARCRGCSVTIRAEGERAWSAATYVGARHDLVVSGVPAAAVSAWLIGLGEELSVPGHVVAEISASPAGRIAALTLEA